MEDGLAPGPSRDPLAVLAGEHGVSGCEGEGGLGWRDTDQEEDNAEHVIVSSSSDPPLITYRTRLSKPSTAACLPLP